MRVTCKRCGALFEAKTARAAYCKACRRRVAVERSMEKAGTEGNAALAAERLRRGYTAEEMAAYLGIDRNTYYTAEHYGREPGREARRKIEGRLGIPADKLFGELAYIHMCRMCGNTFQTDNARGRLCPDCEAVRQPCRRPPHARKAMSVQQIAAQARAAGMTYGQYVSVMEGRG